MAPVMYIYPSRTENNTQRIIVNSGDGIVKPVAVMVKVAKPEYTAHYSHKVVKNNKHV